MSQFSFGKYRGQDFSSVAATDAGYIQWLLGTDFSSKHPRLAQELRDVLAAPAELTLTVEQCDLKLVEAPELGYRIRGAGAMRDGAADMWQLVLQDGSVRRNSLKRDSDSVSRSGRSGYVSHIVPGDGIYEIRSVWGSVANQRQEHVYYYFDGARWFQIGGGQMAATGLVTNQEILAQAHEAAVATAIN